LIARVVCAIAAILLLGSPATSQNVDQGATYLNFAPAAVPVSHSVEIIPEVEATISVWYLGHDGFAVESGDKLLIFDYVTVHGTPSTDPEAGGLTDGIIEPADLDGLDVYVFVSHAHADHYDQAILEWEDEVDRITYLFGWQAGYNPGHHYLIGPRAIEQVDGVDVYTINSAADGIPEVAWLIRADDRWIYHNGDYAGDYVADFEYLGGITDHIDLLFLPGVYSTRSQWTRQNIALIEGFAPDLVFPMHSGGREHEGEEFARVMKEWGCEAVIPVPGARGDRWVLEG
jgi:L-ascorbate metabolism protein UlaG (beta-lactamase superfamily)